MTYYIDHLPNADKALVLTTISFLNYDRVFQEMLYGIQTGFGSPQVPVAELLARPAPTLLSPTPARQKSSNFLQVPDIESPR